MRLPSPARLFSFLFFLFIFIFQGTFMGEPASDDQGHIFEPGDRPEINPMFLFRWEETQDAHVLLYPEGVVKLNGSAGEILKHCDGKNTVGEITAKVRAHFSAGDREAEKQVETGVIKFLEVSHAKGWVRHKA